MNPGMHSRVKAFLRKRNDPKETNVFHDEGKSFAMALGMDRRHCLLSSSRKDVIKQHKCTAGAPRPISAAWRERIES
jgi:hypothetical protein